MSDSMGHGWLLLSTCKGGQNVTLLRTVLTHKPLSSGRITKAMCGPSLRGETACVNYLDQHCEASSDPMPWYTGSLALHHCQRGR